MKFHGKIFVVQICVQPRGGSFRSSSHLCYIGTGEQIPEHLCCKITMDIFRDPVITPSGVSYERAVLYEHLRKVSVDFISPSQCFK